MIVVADSSPLIALARIGRLELLHELFGLLLVPEAVWQELTAVDDGRAGVAELMKAAWLERRGVQDQSLVSLLRQNLGAGESEAIVLARESGADVLLMDESLGRAAAKRLGLPVTGLVGVLIEARERGLLADASDLIRQLREQAGFWISDALAALVENAE